MKKIAIKNRQVSSKKEKKISVIQELGKGWKRHVSSKNAEKGTGTIEKLNRR